MSRAKDLHCWEIMNCQDDRDCPARHDTDHSCWELAQEFKHLQNVLGVCHDCLVYMIKSGSASFSAEELADILANRKSCVPNSPKCISIMANFRTSDDERRRLKRFKVSGKPLTICSEYTAVAEHSETSDPIPLQLLDISKSGLAFLDPDAGLDQKNICLDIKINGYHLKSLSGRIISHLKIPALGEKMRRCGFRFTELSGSQCAMLENLLTEFGQVC